MGRWLPLSLFKDGASDVNILDHSGQPGLRSAATFDPQPMSYTTPVFLSGSVLS